MSSLVINQNKTGTEIPSTGFNNPRDKKISSPLENTSLPDLDKSKFKDKITSVIKFVETTFINTCGMRIIKNLQSINMLVRNGYYFVKQADPLINPHIAEKIANGFKDERPIAQVSNPIGATRLLNAANIPANLINLVKSIIQLVEAKNGLEGFDKFLEVIKSITTNIGTAETLMYGLKAAYSAIQITTLAIKIFSISSLVGTTASYITTCRSIFKTRQIQHEFNKISHTDYKTLQVFLTTDKNLACFGIDKKSKFKESINKLIENKSEIPIEDQIKVDILIKDLKGRLKVKQGFHVVSLISNCISLSLSALTIASIAFPPLLTITIAFAVTTFIVTTLYDSVSNYRFENKMGMIKRKREDLYTHHSTLWKVKDFFQWNLKNIIHNE